MCLINFQFHDHPNYKLIIAANRDEFYKRPTAPAQFWEDNSDILAGRDLVGMGTWLGITKSGRIAALTNYRDPNEDQQNKKSRGHIVKDFLESSMPVAGFFTGLKHEKNVYGGFNFIAGNPEQLYYYSNIEDSISMVSPGTHGLSNEFLDTPWPKVMKGKERLASYLRQNATIETDPLFDIISDAEQAPDELLPDTGVGLDFERKLSPLFIKTPEYGTRCSTVLLVDRNNQVTFIERRFNKGHFENESRFTFQLNEA
ncbi:NRDE family protein [Lentibacillus jeotgali]|uniref:NRDE family protein n=1 Tax=Lentibacillus jeotgali TaxID=558169 RepID=UPI00026267FB|nr:NRDE family protein [Lentibacillus jeotgali]